MYRLFIWCLLVGCQCLSYCHAQHAWDGTYTYRDELGRNADGLMLAVDYRIKIDKDTCEIVVVGYQVNDELICKAIITKNNSIDVNFVSYKDGSLTGGFPYPIYPSDKPLVSLMTDDGTLMTEWGSLQMDERLERRGIYFVKAIPKT